MCDEWMPSLELRLTFREYEQLPRHAAYKYEYIDGSVLLSPWPRQGRARLDLARLPVQEEELPFHLRPLCQEDQGPLVNLFAGAFRFVQPFGSLDRPTLQIAAERCLQRALSGGEGPWVPSASFVAHVPDQDQPFGAALVTLLPGGDPSDASAYRWHETPPADLWQRGAGQPHLTWLFVAPFHKRHGLGTALLAASGRVLRAQGYDTLWSTFLVGNEGSMLWHWRNGFELISRG